MTSKSHWPEASRPSAITPRFSLTRESSSGRSEVDGHGGEFRLPALQKCDEHWAAEVGRR